MTYTLDVWHYRTEDTARNPVAINSDAELAELLDYLLAHTQPHPAQIVARERPTIGPRKQPDTVIKVAVAEEERLGALLFVSPKSWDEPAEGDTSTGVYVTRGAPGGPALYIDKATRTPFPADAALPVERIHAALAEFRQTGELPTCVEWQESAVY